MIFSNFTIPINEFSIILFFIVCFVSYFFIFKEHHKKNELKFHEIFPLIIHYLILCIISFFVLMFGIDRVLMGYVYNEEIYEVINEFITGFSIISVVIINFIFYIKKHKIDLIKEEREETVENTEKIAEIIEFIILILVFFIPIANIFKNINYWNKMDKIRNFLSGI